MKHLFIFIIIAALLFSCNKNDKRNVSFNFMFYPRHVKHIWCDYSTLIPAAEIEGKMGYFLQDFTGVSLASDMLILGVYTGNLNLDTVKIETVVQENCLNRFPEWPLFLTHYQPISFMQNVCIKPGFVDEGGASMELQIKNAYNRYANSLSSSGSQWLPPPIMQDYRLTEIRNLSITGNVTLFGLPAGSSLNRHFKIYDLNPACVFHGNMQMALDYAQTRKEIQAGFSIEEWLSFRPISATWFYFKLTSEPPELPVNDVVFTITVETAEGDLLECTGKPVTLTR